ncbi:YceI family protein [Ferrimonas sediminicola]|uniref:YceI family protein n=1 Tax=Ferrimonas sediminicola TaxID=2569538 RepID=A0A4U1BJG9_9GAMM|nr:YceI family protein [Ferrimonas sediminicola]TKB51315.1 YceI family protein [Ferrimonas sediminicola]
MKMINAALLGSALAFSALAMADDYAIDTKGAHASINFKINHLGYSWVIGRFDSFKGSFSYDGDAPAAFRVTIDTASVNSNHAERDKHIRSEDLLEVNRYPEAKFTSTAYTAKDAQSGVLHGDFTLRGVTKPIAIEVQKIGEGQDPWGGYRVGFEGSTTLKMKEFGIPMDLGPQSAEVQLDLHVEGVRL